MLLIFAQLHWNMYKGIVWSGKGNTGFENTNKNLGKTWKYLFYRNSHEQISLSYPFSFDHAHTSADTRLFVSTVTMCSAGSPYKALIHPFLCHYTSLTILSSLLKQCPVCPLFLPLSTSDSWLIDQRWSWGCYRAGTEPLKVSCISFQLTNSPRLLSSSACFGTFMQWWLLSPKLAKCRQTAHRSAQSLLVTPGCRWQATLCLLYSRSPREIMLN